MTMNQQAFSNPQTQSYTATQYAPTPTNFQHAQHSTMTPAPQPPPPPPPPATNYNTQYTQQQYGPVRPSTRNVKVATFNQANVPANTAINRPAQPTTQPVTKAPPNQHITPVTPPTQIKDQRTPRATGAPTSTQTTQDTTPQHVVPHSVAIPDKWNPTDERHDSSTNTELFNQQHGPGGEASKARIHSVYQWQHVPDTALSQIAKSLRDQSVDLGMVAEASHKGQIPSKTSGPVRFFRPLIQCVVDKIKNKVPVENKNRSTSLQPQKPN